MNQPATGRIKPLPRHQRGIAPQNIIAVLFGDYWFARQEPIPSAALVEILEIFGISENGSRAAIQRLAHRKFLVAYRQGRRTAYAVHTSGTQNLTALIQRLFQAHLPQKWDGTWTVLTYGAPGLQTPNGRLIREELKERAFGHLNDSLWIKPGHHGSEVAEVLAKIPSELAEVVTYFENATLPSSTSAKELREFLSADEFDHKCQEFTDYWQNQAKKMAGTWPEGDDALRLRTRVMSEWRALIRDNPRLPAEMMLEPPPLQIAAQTCAVFYDNLGYSAAQAVRAIIKRHEPSLAGLVTHHTFEGAEALIEQVLVGLDSSERSRPPTSSL